MTYIYPNEIKGRERCCEYCGSTKGLTVHHVFYGMSRSKFVKDINGDWNKVYLCELHHQPLFEKASKPTSVHGGNTELRKWLENRALRRLRGEKVDSLFFVPY